MTTVFNCLKSILLLLLFVGYANAQSPGGVSNNLDLWLRASDLATNPNATSGSSDWPNVSPGATGALDAIYVSAAANSLYGIGNGINFNKTIRVNDEFFESPVDINQTDVSVFMVYKSINAPTTRPLWGNGSATFAGKQAYLDKVADGTGYTNYGPAGTQDRTYLNHINSVDGNVTDNSTIYINGNAGTAYTTGTTVDAGVHPNFFIGKEQDATVPSHTNNTLAIAEVLVYTGVVLPAEREQINSYLGIKYGINLGHNYTINSGGITVWDRTVNSTYSNNVVGIAKDNTSGLDVNKSKSEANGALVTISTTQTIPNNGALLVGHNNAVSTGSSPFTTNSFFVKGRRLNRVWKCQKTANFPATVDIAIDENINLPTNNFDLGNMVLLVSDQANMSSNVEAYALTENSTTGDYEATGVVLGDGEFFTIAYLDVALWIKADASQNTTTSGAPFEYYDNVMGINSMSSPNTNRNPTHVLGTDPSSINFNPYIKFNDGAQNQYIGKSNFTAFGNDDGVSTFLVLRRGTNNVNPNDFESMFSYAVSGQPNEMVMANPPNLTVAIKETNLNAGHNSAFDITNSIPHVFSNLAGTVNDNDIRLNGNVSSANYARSEVITPKGTLIFGQEQDNLGGGFDVDQAYEGDIAEAIIFNKRITDDDRDEVETYLAIKYGITLMADYMTPSGRLWNMNAGANSPYHNNIAVIAREDVFDLNQQKSTSQNGADVDVTINYTTPFSQDQSYLLWGCNTGIYDNLSLTNAPAGYQTSDKIWRVKNRNNQVGLVEVTLRIPPSLSSIATNKLKLIVENSSTFTSAAVFYSSSSSVPGFITFTGVNLQNNNFFSLALEDSPTIVSYNNAGNSVAPTSFEACVGDVVTFDYTNLTSHPNKLEMTDDQGGTFNINLVAGTNINYTVGLGSSGTITITIPPNASTGNVRLIDSSSTVIIVYNFNNNLIIHKPVVDFYLPPAPFCATDTMPLIGIPSGGTFSATPANLIFNNHSLVGINANWTANMNDSTQDVSIDYTYIPAYLNGQVCANSIVTNKVVTIRDNRLDTLRFAPIILDGTLPSITDRVVLNVDSLIVDKVVPSFSPARNYPVSFSGNYVNHNNGIDSFFTDHAGYSSNEITMQYDNGGCIGELTADLDVLFPLQLSGVVDILCNDADSIILKRDSRPEYVYSTSTSMIGTRTREIIETNIINSVTTKNPAHQSAITTVNTTPNQEEYYLDPKVAALNGFNTVVVVMNYTATRITTENLNSQGAVVSSSTRNINSSSIEYPITLVDRPILDFDLDTVYCKTAPIDSLLPSPIFESPFSRFNYRFSYFASGPYSPSDSLPGQVFDASYIYDQAVPLGAQNQDLYVELEYVLERYGCTDSYIQNTRIIRPIAFSLFLDPPPVITGYCNNSTPIKLEPINTMTNAQGVGEFLVDGLANSPLIDTGNYFLPDSAQSQNYNISYQFTDTANCTSTSTVKIISIREPAVIELQIDGNATNPRICANRDNALLETRVISGTPFSSITYSSTNLIIVGDTLKPADSYNNVNGTIIQNITVNYRDSFSCASSDDLLVEVYKPLPRMAGFLGNPNNNIYTYCNNKSPFSIIETPNHLTGRDTILGAAVLYVNGVYSYDPNLVVVDSSIMDTVRYEYEDALGCTAFTERIVRIDSIPDINLVGLDTAYCVNNAPVQLTGTPNSSSGFARYLGAGVDQQGIFSPSLAGIGIKNITYAFEDGNGCENTITDLTTINALPLAQYNFPQNQYCTSARGDSLDTIATTGIYTFWGSIIDSSYIINPQGAVGQQTVFYSLMDSLGCMDTNSITIFVHPLPTITISGLDSAYCFNGGTDNILISPTAGSILTGSAPGFSINSTGVTFDPSYDSSGIKNFTYAYQDNITRCADTVRLNTTVYQVPSPIYTGGDSVYCAIDSLYSITGIPAGGMFSGAGVTNTGGQSYFNPILTGGGNQTLNYRVDTNIIYNASDTLSCPVTIDIPIVVNQLPNLAFDGPGDNYRFCSNEANVLLGGTEPIKTWRLFTSPTLDAIDTIITFVDIPLGGGLFQRIRDTAYFFSPANAGAGIHNITYTGTDSLTGCQDTVPLTYYVTDYGTGASFLLDSAHCASSDSILLTGNPAGGHFLRNQDTLSSSYFVLSTSTYLLDTVTYHVTYDACMASDTQLIEVNPLVNLSFVGNEPSKTYCFGGDDSPLVPNISGGTFNGNAVISGDSLFSLQYANAGDNIISYTFIDSVTYCESVITDTFFVFGMPNIDFNAIGGCQSDSIFFHPNNAILGLNNTFGSRIIDSITDVVWELEPGLFINGTNNSNNEIDSINHIYSSPGVYQTKLYVANRTYCVDTTTVRVVISPTITSNQFPYDETFENSNGNWYAEAKDTSHRLLWEWGIDTIGRGINEPNNNIWVTNLNGRYGANEAAWVYSPCFDISNLERPMIRFDHWSDSRSRGDGTVLELQNPDGTWSPLGELDRGISWFNSDFIAGSPGDQSLSPVGWSGQSNEWINSRYKLDEFKNISPSKLRLRMAFGSSSINLGTFYNGFAFDNVWIGNRTRNVLLETTSNIYEPDMDYVNNYVYQLAYHSNINKDVILLQYHSDAPNNSDEFHQFDTRLGNVKPYIYGIPDAGTAFIDGIINTQSKWLTDLSFEQNMLESPKFDVVIDTFYHTNQPGEFTMTVTITALVDIPTIERYHINMFITEDSLSYSSGENVHAVVRKDYPSNSINNFNRSWAVGEQITLTHTYSATDLNYVPNHFQAVAFIQAEDPNAREVFQAATTRDVSGYWVGVDQVVSEQELNEIKDMNLYPNPAKDHITIDFPELLKKDYNWKLVSIGGITVKEDVLQAGEQSLTINNYDLPSGVYIFMVYNGNVYSQRKVIINQN